ncbi:hypothetical protein LLG95_02360 [bacterium]|nr:hypothetical protein [bacterium]
MIITKVRDDQASSRPAQLFSMRDMLMPAELLERTNWRDNPLVVYSQRRGRWLFRVLMTRLLEIFLVFWCYEFLTRIVVHVHRQETELNELALTWRIHCYLGDGVVAHHLHNLPFSITISIFLGIPVFLLLRYHLFINDHSHHIKTLSYERLSELLLTRLGREEFFLHHFLMFCQRYRAIVAFGAIALVCWGKYIASGESLFFGTIYQLIPAMLNIVVLTWIAGVLQYVMEWKWFAGGRARVWRPVASFFYSVILACPITLISLAMMNALLFYSLPSCLMIWLIAVTCVHAKGSEIYILAEEQLWSRIGDSAPKTMNSPLAWIILFVVLALLIMFVA